MTRPQTPDVAVRAAAPPLHPFAPFVFLTEETTVSDLRRYLADIRSCGFNCIRFGGEGGCGVRYLGEDRYDFSHIDLIFDLAEEAGLRIIPNARVGYCDWMAAAPHGVKRATHLLDDEYHRLIAKYAAAVARRYCDRPCLLAYEGVGEPARFPDELIQEPRFADAYHAWLKGQYGSLENMGRAWGYAGPLLQGVDAWDAWRRLAGTHFEKYRHRRDLARFKTEFFTARMTAIERCWQREDPRHPVLTGVHQLLGNAANNGWDFELQASTADGFFSSIHAGWHFWILPDEFLLPLCVQARLTADLAKGKWALPYETTGGPNFRSAIRQHNMHAAEHEQMMVCYLGAGLQGVGLWAWNCRLSGPEAGEYGLTTLQGTPSLRARRLGAWCRQVERHRAELDAARSERCAAILYSWEAEFFSSQRDLGSLDGTSMDENSRNRLGAARALLNRNIPFEFITDNELIAGAAASCPVLIVPGMAVVSDAAMAALLRHVEAGGRVVADAPFAAFDDCGRVRTAGAGGVFERLVGAYATNHFNARYEPRQVQGLPLGGAFSELAVTTATVFLQMDDGRPAAVRHAVGRGEVVCFGHEVASRCFRPGHVEWEERLAQAVLGKQARPWRCAGGIAFRRRCEAADHYFVVAVEPRLGSVTITADDAVYLRAEDVLADRLLPVCSESGSTRFDLPAATGRGFWVRCARSGV